MGGALLAASISTPGWSFVSPCAQRHKLLTSSAVNGSVSPTAMPGITDGQDTSAGRQSGPAMLALTVAGCSAALRRRKNYRGHLGGHRSVVPRGSTGTDVQWQPRTSGWTTEELAQEKARVSKTLEAAAPSGYTGPRYESPASVTSEFIDQLIASQEKGALLPKRDAFLMVLDVIELLRKERSLMDVTIPQGKELTIIGDLHGQYWDFMNMLKLTGRPSPDTPFLFNGDFVDRGSWSMEVILTLFAFKLKDPSFVFMNRGNHEMLETNILYGFCGECGAKYDLDLFDLFSEAFRNLPLAHLVQNKALVLHAGLPGPEPRIWMPGQTHDPTDAIPMTYVGTLEEIAKVDRYIEITPDAYPNSIGPTTDEKEVNDMRKLIDLLWSDPRGGPGYGPSYRKGKGVYMFGPDVTDAYCEKNNLQCIVRSHEVKAAGCRWDHEKLLTVFSAPNYLDTGNNQGAFLRMSQPGGPDAPLQIESTSFDAVPHPDLPPMHWQEIIVENYPHLLRKMKKKVAAADFDEFGDSDFSGLMNFDEWEPDEADSFQEAFKLDEYGREKS